MKSAYLSTAYGATRPGGSGTAIVLGRNGQAEITIRLPRGAVIAGEIRDAAGAPLPGVSVTARRVDAVPDAPLPVPVIESDADGRYRLYGLPTGEYVVQASQPLLGSYTLRQPTVVETDAALAALARRVSSDFARLDAQRSATETVSHAVMFAPVFFPGVPTPEEATTIRVASGEVREDVDIVFKAIPTASVVGAIAGSPMLLRSAQVGIRPSGTGRSSSMMRTSQPAPDGTFGFAGLAPGRYTLLARANESGIATSTARSPSIPVVSTTTPVAEAARTAEFDFLYATAEVDLRPGDAISGLGLVLQPGGTVAGRVQFDPASAIPASELTRLRVTLEPDASAPIMLSSSFTVERSADVRPDRTFTVRSLAPGTYRLKVDVSSVLAAAGWWPRSAMTGDRDLLDGQVVIEQGTPSRDVVLTLSNRHTELSGTVFAATGQIASAYVVVAFGTMSDSWDVLSRRTRIVRPGTDGRYDLRDLPPGDYFVAAVTDIDRNQLMTPAFFEQLLPASLRVTLSEGTSTTLDVHLAR